MKKNLLLALLILAAFSSMGMAKKAQYDEEARAMEKAAESYQSSSYDAPSPGQAAKNFVGGIKQATVDSTRSLLGETAAGTKESPLVGTIEGARDGSQSALDNAVKGTARVATLGYGSVDQYEVEEPKTESDDLGKIRIKIPGT